MTWRLSRSQSPPSKEEESVLLEAAARPVPLIALQLLRFCATAGEEVLPLAWRILERLPLAELPSNVTEEVWDALTPRRKRQVRVPQQVVAEVLQHLVPVPELNVYRHADQLSAIAQAFPRETYELLRNRILHGIAPDAPKGYQPFPSGFHFNLRIPGLFVDRDYKAICDDLWQRVLNREAPNSYYWLKLWQAVVLNDDEAWLSRLQHEIGTAQSAEDLSALVEAIRFDGSLVVFRFPDLTRAFLTKAQTLGSNELFSAVRASLAVGCGPMSRGYTNGVLDEKYDYVEFEAAKAAETHASDPVLGPFYRWIVETEQRDRLWHKARSDAEMAALE